MDLPAGPARSRRRRKFYEELAEGLIDYGESVFRRAHRRSDGATGADHTAARSRIAARLGKTGNKGKAEKTESEPAIALPEEARHVWAWFLELMNGASPGFGPSVITWRDVAAWAALTGERPEPWEARALVALSARRETISSQLMAEERGSQNPR